MAPPLTEMYIQIQMTPNLPRRIIWCGFVVATAELVSFCGRFALHVNWADGWVGKVKQGRANKLDFVTAAEQPKRQVLVN